MTKNKIKVIKRDGRDVEFNAGKIEIAILKAMRHGSGMVDEDIAIEIAQEIYDIGLSLGSLSIEQIEKIVYHKLIDYGHEETARSYEGYRAVQAYKRENNTTDNSIMGLLNFTNEEVMRENSNKNAVLNSTQRDLIAGEVSKDMYTRKYLPPHLAQAHRDGIIHIHK